MRKSVVLLAALAALFLIPATAGAAPPASVFDGAVTCDVQGPGASEGQVWCGTGDSDNASANPADHRSTVKSFDGMPIDVNFALPDEDEFGAGPYPLVMMFHGYGGSKPNFAAMQHWLNKGYATFSQTNRGFHESCGTQPARDADPTGCANGWILLDDTRYEVRDAQVFSGMLVDEGLVKPDKIAASGGSYGGGMSMALAALKDRVMLPDSTYAPWKSPDGTPMELAVSIPDIPWTDLAQSLLPNGSTLDYIEDAPYYGPFGVMKQSYVNGLYMGGAGAGIYAPVGTTVNGDVTGWKALMDAGEPYQGQPEARAMLEEITQHHSSYYIDHSQAPAPLYISSGFTDDLFPANEATRFYNRTRAEFPNAKIGLFFGSFGHMRGQNKPTVNNAKAAMDDQWVDWYLAGEGSEPANDVTTFTQTCPNDGGTPDGGPFVTDDWVSQSPGEIVVQGGDAQDIEPWGGDRGVGGAFNSPLSDACRNAAADVENGIASYDLDPAPTGGYTVMGSPTVIATYTTTAPNAQVAARLVDVSANGLVKRLVNRAIWRLDGSGRQVFQLWPNGMKIEEGRHLRLELLPFDGGSASQGAALANASRPSNEGTQTRVTVSDLELRVPVQEQPGAVDGLVTAPAPRVLPDRPGVALAPGNEDIGSVSIVPKAKAGKLKVQGKPTVKGKVLTARVKCVGNGNCAKANVVFKGVPKGKRFKLAGQQVKVAAGKTKTVKFKLTNKARNFFKDKKKKVRRNGKVRVRTVKGPKKLQVQVTIGGKKAGKTVVRRTGKVR